MEDFSDLPRENRLSNSMWKNRAGRLARAPPLKRKTKATGNQTKDVIGRDAAREERGVSTVENNDEQTVVYRQKATVAVPSLDDEEHRQAREYSAEIEDPFAVRIFFITSNNDDTSMSDKPETVWFDDEVKQENLDLIEQIRNHSNNRHCADCHAENPNVALVSFLLIVCEKCADVHQQFASFQHQIQSLNSICNDSEFFDLFQRYGNRTGNEILENRISTEDKICENATPEQREHFIRKKYFDKRFVRPLNIENLNQTLYENVESNDVESTLTLMIHGADPNYCEKSFSVVDHAKLYQQTKQVKILLANGGISEVDLTKINTDNVNEIPAFLASRYGILKSFLTRYEDDRLKIYSLPTDSNKSRQLLNEIDLNRILAFYNETIDAVPLKCRLRTDHHVQKSSQCRLIVDQITRSNEYIWVFPEESQRSFWIRAFVQRQFSYHALISPNFIFLTQIHLQQGFNAEKQQMTVVVYPQSVILCSDMTFEKIDLRKTSNLTDQKIDGQHVVFLHLVDQRFLYFSSPISRLTDLLSRSLRQATTVKTLTDLNSQLLTSKDVPVIVENFIKFIFTYGLKTKGIYRQAGYVGKIKKLLNECLENPNTTALNRSNYSEHDVANALKRFLRQLDPPLLGARQNYDAWLRSVIDPDKDEDYLIPYYRALLKDLKTHLPIHYFTLRTMIIHLQTVAMLSDVNGMTLSNLVSTFTPCFISHFYRSTENMTDLTHDDEVYSQIGTRDPSSFRMAHRPLPESPSSSSLPSSYARVTPCIENDLQIMSNLCRYAKPLFDITDEEIAHEEKCVETLRFTCDDPAPLEARLISVYFESRDDELNGYAINVFENETTADIVIEKLLSQLDKTDCFFWALFEVIIDQNLERPMFSCENIHEVLDRYRLHLNHELNFQATFVLKLNYLEFEKERLQQRQIRQDHSFVSCEMFDETSRRWISCSWVFQRAKLEVYRSNNNQNRLDRRLSSIVDPKLLIYSWPIDEIYLYIGADCRIVSPFDMNEYRVLTILSNEFKDLNSGQYSFGYSFRFLDRNQMFSWYLELVHINGHDKWTRNHAPHIIPDGASYLPLQNYHVASNRKKSVEWSKNKFVAKSFDVASNFCKRLLQ